MYDIITLNWFLCQLQYRIGKKMSHQNYATNSEWRECIEKSKKFTSHSDTMLEPIQTTGSPLTTSICSTPKMQRNMYWYHYCNDLLEILDIHPLFSGKLPFWSVLVPKARKSLLGVHVLDWKVHTQICFTQLNRINAPKRLYQLKCRNQYFHIQVSFLWHGLP